MGTLLYHRMGTLLCIVVHGPRAGGRSAEFESKILKQSRKKRFSTSRRRVHTSNGEAREKWREERVEKWREGPFSYIHNMKLLLFLCTAVVTSSALPLPPTRAANADKEKEIRTRDTRRAQKP